VIVQDKSDYRGIEQWNRTDQTPLVYQYVGGRIHVPNNVLYAELQITQYLKHAFTTLS